MMNGIIIFFIGTTAELIKLFPIIKQLEGESIPYLLISSGQNDLIDSKTLQKANGGRIDLVLSNEKDITKTSFGLLKWWFSVFFQGLGKIKSFLKGYDFKRSVLVVHGDTVSTVMGAMIGRVLGIPVAHVEAGLRSFHLMNPFPEEIDRIITSKLANVSFAPGDIACNNLKKSRTEVVNTYFNTAVDSLEIAKEIECSSEVINDLSNKEYFVFVLHRQENLTSKEFVQAILEKIVEVSKRIPCVIILHKITENAFINFGFMDWLKQQENITMLERQEYFDFITLLSNSSFVITDGGSNQEELSYLGKPCFILRNYTERFEGIGENAIMYDGDPEAIVTFAENRNTYRREPFLAGVSPTEIIIGKLKQMTNRKEQ